ncbi:MAG TPA: UDP-N-acetylmuramate--L-alanine ligase [Pseudonocardia sp.]
MSTSALGERVHLVGIGGAGMSGIARLLLARGVAVSGSDAAESAAVAALRALGARVAVGHDAAHLPEGPATVVVSTAIRPTNPELRAAVERGLPVVHRARALAALAAGRRLAAVAGTHGKTSTTSMLTVALRHCGLDPSFAIGGDLTGAGVGAHHGGGELFVVEADESDGSFTAFAPDVAVVTNVEPDHLDHHGTEQAYRAVFADFVDGVVPGGTLVACADDPGVTPLVERARERGLAVRTYGRAGGGAAHLDAALVAFVADGTGSRVRVRFGDAGERVLRLAVPGEHMALNALAAALAAEELGASRECVVEGLAAFDGVRRRFEHRGAAGGVAVYDDYAHHPTEVAATLRAARAVAGPGRVLVAFQPHLYSRTRTFAAGFGAALAHADEVVVLDVYGAREDPEPGVTGALVADAVPLPRDRVHHVPRRADVAAVLAGLARPGDLVLTMGAGDVTALAPDVLAALGRRPGPADPTAPSGPPGP